MKWSKYQKDFFNQVKLSDRNLCLEALAGSGKTTTLIKSLEYVGREPTLMLAFSKAVAKELQSRNLPGNVKAATSHSYGFGQINFLLNSKIVKPYYVTDMARQYFPKDKEVSFFINDFVSAVKNDFVPIDNLDLLDEVIDDWELTVPEHYTDDRAELVEKAAKILQKCKESKVINYDDMIWLPLVLDLPIKRYKNVFVDEGQDLCPAQIELVCRASSNRIITVADRFQSIFAFRGADKDAVPNMIERFDMACLPLSITYRCPISVVKEAQRIVPALEAAPNAVDGSVTNAGYSDIVERARAGDFVISRTNAPLLKLAFKFISRGKKMSIKGRDIGKGLVLWVKSSKAKTIKTLIKKINEWEEKEVNRLKKAERGYRHIIDKAECLRIVAEQFVSINEVIRKLEELFSDEEGGVILTSTHRAKGLETDRVWLLKDTYCRWPGDEERNLLYVGITRAKKELIYCFKDD